MKNYLKILIVMLILISTIGYASAANGDILWDADMTDSAMAICIDSEGYIYAGDTNGHVRKYDSEGTWVDNLEFTTSQTADPDAGWIYYNNMALSPDETVLYAQDYGDSNIFAINTADMTEKWKVNYGGSDNGIIVDNDGYIYCEGFAKVYKLDPTDGSIVWEYTDVSSGYLSWFAATPAINKDGTILAITYECDDSGEAYLDFLSTETGARVGTTFGNGGAVAYDATGRPHLFFDLNDEVIVAGNGGDPWDACGVRVDLDGNVEKLGSATTDEFYYNGATVNENNDVVLTQSYSTAKSFNVFDDTTLATIHDFGILELDEITVENQFAESYPLMDENNVAYVHYGDSANSVLLAMNTVSEEIKWYKIFSMTEYNLYNMAFMSYPTNQIIIADETGLCAIEVDAAPMWTRNDHTAGTIGISANMMATQPFIEEEEVVVEEEEPQGYGVVIITEPPIEEEIIEEEIIEEKETNVIFGDSLAGKDNWFYILAILGAYIGAYGACRYKKLATVSNVATYGTMAWIIPILITVFIFDMMMILNNIIGNESLIITFITFIIYGVFFGAISKDYSKKKSKK